MKPRIHVLTLAVDDLERALSFYRRLGLESTGVIASEFEGDKENAAGAIATFELEAGSSSPSSRAVNSPKMQGSPRHRPVPAGSASATRWHAEDVDATLDAAEAAGTTITVKAYDRPFGVYSGYFQDPDGHLWEVLWNPALDGI